MIAGWFPPVSDDRFPNNYTVCTLIWFTLDDRGRHIDSRWLAAATATAAVIAGRPTGITSTPYVILETILYIKIISLTSTKLFVY